MSAKNSELRERWENHLNRWAQSGKSQTEYCKEHNLAIKSFGYWKRKLSEQRDAKFIEITQKQLRMNSSAFIELITPDGMVIRFREDISSSCLKNIVTILRG